MSEYRVIEILNKQELLINYGSSNGARIGNKVIIAITGPEVTDPKTNKLLGTLDIVKEELEIYRTYPNFSICRNITYEERDVLSPFGMQSKTITKSHSLNIEEQDVTNRWPVNVPPVKVGDIVQILKNA